MKDTKNHTILHLRGSDFYGSVEKLIAGQMKHLENFYCSCASFKKTGKENQFLKEMRRQAFASFDIDDKGFFDRKIPGRLAGLINSNGIDLLVTHDYKSRFYGSRAAKKTKIPHVAYFHGWTSEDLKVRFYNYLDKKLMRKADRIIAVSKSSASVLSRAGIPTSRISVIYNAYETSAEIPPTRMRHAPLVIGVIGRLSWEKGVHVFLRALATIKGKAPEFKAEIYGDGPYNERLRKLSVHLGLDDKVDFKGFREDIDKVYDNIDFLVVPSLSEGHPLVILEAWAGGIGIIASRAGGIPEILENGKSGILVDTDNPEMLGSAIRRALTDYNVMIQYGRTGFETLKRRFNCEQQESSLTAVYNDVLGVDGAQ